MARKDTHKIYAVQLLRHGRHEYGGAGPVAPEVRQPAWGVGTQPREGVVMSEAPPPYLTQLNTPAKPQPSVAAPPRDADMLGAAVDKRSRSKSQDSQDSGRERIGKTALLQGYDPNTWDPPLRYGDTVALVLEGQNALVAYAGTTDGRPWVEVLHDDATFPPNADACQWRLEPAARHEAPKKLKAFLKEKVWDEGKGLPVPDIPEKHADLQAEAAEFVEAHGLSEDSHALVRELFDLLLQVGDEREAMIVEQERLRGKQLSYGNALELVHVLTGTVLTITKDRGIEEGSKRLSMDEWGSNRSNLVLRPAYKTYVDGASVASGDLVQFVTRGTVKGVQFWLHVSDHKRLGADPNIVRRQLMNDHPCITGGQEVNAVTGDPTLFRLLTFRTLENTFGKPDLVKGDAVFTFYHRQAGGYLHYDPDVSERPFFYESNRLSDRQRKKSQWLWRIESCRLYNGGDEVTCKEGSKMRYRIKHVLTDMYMVHKNGSILVTKNFEDPDTKFSFRHFVKDARSGVLHIREMIFIKTNEGDFLTQADPPDTKSLFEEAQVGVEKKDKENRIKHLKARQLDQLPDADAISITPANRSTLKAVIELKRLLENLKDFAEQLSLMKDCAPGTASVQQKTGGTLSAVLARQDPIALMDKTIDGEGEEGVMEIVENCFPFVEPVLRKLVLNLSHGDEPSPLARDGEPNRLLQKHLRELKILPLAARLLELPFEKGVDINQVGGRDFFAHLLTILNLLYRLLKQMAKQNMVNSKLLLEYLPLFRAQLGKGILVTPTLKEIFHNKRPLLNAMPPEVISDFLRLLRKEKAPQYIDFLMNICTSGPISQLEPVVGVQRAVTEALGQNPEVLPSIKLHYEGVPSSMAGDQSLQRISAVVQIGDERLNLASFNQTRQKGGKEWDYAGWILHSELSDLSKSEKALRYFIRCLNLFARLALGRNQDALRMLICNASLALSYNEIMLVLKETSVPQLIRARYLVLMARLYVDRDPQISTPMLTSTRVWSKVVPEPSDLKMDVVEGTAAIPVCTNGFMDLQQFMLMTVPNLAGCKDEDGKLSLNACPQVGQLELIRAEYIVCEMLLNFGYFRDDVKIISRFFHSAFLVLDSRDPLLGASGAHHAEHAQNKMREKALLERSETHVVATMRNEVREEVLSFLLRLLDLRLDRRLTDCIAVWESVFQTVWSSGKLHTLMDPSKVPRESSGQNTQSDSEIAELERIFAGSHDIVEGLQARLFNQSIISPPVIGSDIYRPGDVSDNTQMAMLDLCTFGVLPLTQAAMALLIRNMSQRNALVNSLNDVQILVYPQAARLHREAQYIIRRMSNLQKHIVAENEASYKEAIGMLKRLTDAVAIRPDNKAEIVAKNQSILLNLSIDIPVRRMLGLYLARDESRRVDREADRPGSEMRRDLFQECYTFLKALVRKNARAQKALFPHIKLFAEHMGIEKLNVADTIAEIVRDNEKLCSQADRHFLANFVWCIKTWGRRARWLSFFQAFILINGNSPVKSAQDIILKLLIGEKEAVLDLTCDYRNTQYLSRADPRYGKTRIDLLLQNDHKRPVFSLIKYHCAAVRLLAACAFGRHEENQARIMNLISIDEVVNNILDIDLHGNGVQETNINQDAVRLVQAPWVALLTDVYLTCNDTEIIKDVARLDRVWGDNSRPSNMSLFSLFGTTFYIFCQRLNILNIEQFVGRPELFDSLEDTHGHDMGAHLDLTKEAARACLAYCEKWNSLVRAEGPPTKEAQTVRNNAVHLYAAATKFRLTGLCDVLVRLITAMSSAGIDGDCIDLQSGIQGEQLKTAVTSPEQAFLQGWPKFRVYLSHTFGIDPRPDQSMNNAIQDIALTLGSTKTHMNDHLQSLERFCQVLAARNCDDFLLVIGMKVLRAIIYMRPVQELASPAKFDLEYQRHLDNEPASDLGTYEHENWQSRIAHVGGVLVACAGIQHTSMDVVHNALLLSTTLLDGGNAYVQKQFTAIMLPASSAPLFKKLVSLFQAAQQEIVIAKREIKLAATQKVALAKAGLTAHRVDDIRVAEDQEHMIEVMLMMQRMCLGDSKLDDVLRHQTANQESFNFFALTESYVSSLEPELKKALSRNDFDVVEAVICGLNLLSEGMHGPNLENQRVIADTGIFDLCDRIFLAIRFEHRKGAGERSGNESLDESRHGTHILLPVDHGILVKRNRMRHKLRVAAISVLDGFLEAVQDPQIVNQMLLQLNWDGVVAKMKECYDMYHRGDSSRGYDLPRELSLQEGLGYYFILKHMKHYDKKKEYIVPELEIVPPKVLAFFEMHTGHIEIVRDSRLERVYFQMPENCLPRGPLDTPKVDVKIYDADLSDMEKKPQQFLHNLCELVEEEEFHDRIRNSALSFTVTRVNLVRSINFLWILSMHMAMFFGSYMPKQGFWLKSFEEDFQARLDQQWYGIMPWETKDDEYGYGYDDGDGGDLRSLSRRLSGARGFKHGRRRGGHHNQHAHLLEKLDTRRAQEWHGSGMYGSGSGSWSQSGSGSGSSASGSGSGSGSAGYECSYDNYCSYSNGEGGGYGRKHGWAFAFNLTTWDVHFFQDVLPVLRQVVRYMSWINLITCAFRFFAFFWAELPMIVWRKLEEKDAENRDPFDEADPEEEEEPESNDNEDNIWIDIRTRKKAAHHHWEEEDDENEETQINGNRRSAQICAVLTSTDVWYEAAFVVFPLIAVITDEPLFSAYSLLEICWWESSRPVTDAGNIHVLRLH